MKLTICLALLMVCLCVDYTECSGVGPTPRFSPIGKVPNDRSVKLTIRDITDTSSSSEPSVSVIGGCPETALRSLFRAADTDRRFGFTGSYTAADGFQVTGIQGKLSDGDGVWQTVVYPKDGGDGVPIDVGLEKFIPEKGASLVFSYVPTPEPTVTTISFDEGETILSAFGDHTLKISRTGDISTTASVIVYTENGLAKAPTDFTAIPNSEDSRVYFEADQSEATFSVAVHSLFRAELAKGFLLKLAEPKGVDLVKAEIGDPDQMEVFPRQP